MGRAINEARRIDGAFFYPGGYDNTGLQTQHNDEEAARRGSELLLAGLIEAQARFSQRWGVTLDDARILLMDTALKSPGNCRMVRIAAMERESSYAIAEEYRAWERDTLAKVQAEAPKMRKGFVE